jgi:hypothetical protein
LSLQRNSPRFFLIPPSLDWGIELFANNFFTPAIQLKLNNPPGRIMQEIQWHITANCPLCIPGRSLPARLKFLSDKSLGVPHHGGTFQALRGGAGY